MNSTTKLSYAIGAILSGSPIGMAVAQTIVAQTADAEGIQEIVVTAQRRTESLQDVPISIQVLTGETLTQLNVETFDDYVKYLPNVSVKSNGPGQGIIYMRGLSTAGTAGNQGSGSTTGFPNVAIYLDDQSGQLPGRNLDIYAADLERIEVLEGPQGTLFGAGAEAGAIRYITNKPKLDVTEGSATAGYGTTAHGANNGNVTAMINLPLIPESLAVRAVVYNDSRGGYIDNVPGTFTREAGDLGIHYANFATKCAIGAPNAAGLCAGVGNKATAFGVPPGSPVANNNNLAQNDFNPVTYQGIRASALYKVNDDWNVLLTQTYQDMNSQGVFYQMPSSSDGIPLQPLHVTVFNPSYDKDQFENTAWTANGKFGELNAVYTGSYLVRRVDQQNDYTNYARGVYADYYQCYGAKNSPTGTANCYSPEAVWLEQERNTHLSNEARLSTPDDWRLRGIVGAFWEEQTIYDQTDFNYKSIPSCTAAGELGCMTDVGPTPTSTLNNPDTRGDNTAFFEDITRGYHQYAFFASADFDIIPKVLTVTGGTRYYRFTNFMNGSVVSSFGCADAGPAPCLNGATNINAENLTSNYSGFKSRGNISWHVTPDTLLYYTYSQGFRPGAFNRTGGCHVDDANGIAQYCIPLKYAPDSLTNQEIGWKTDFFEHRLEVNGAIYQELWNNVQVAFFDPGQLGNLTFNTNGQNFKVRGIEFSLNARVTQGLTVIAAASYNKSEQTNSPYLIANNPALLLNPASAAEYGKPITSLANPFGMIGSPTANSPLFQGSLRVRYDWALNDYHFFAQAAGTYTASSFTQTGNNPSLSVGGAVNTTVLRFEDPAYGLLDASAGVAKDAWNVQLFGQNLADRNVSLFTSTSQFVLTQVPNRPRVLGVQFGYKF